MASRAVAELWDMVVDIFAGCSNFRGVFGFSRRSLSRARVLLGRFSRPVVCEQVLGVNAQLTRS